MHQVIGLIEELRAAGIDVPPYPLLDAPLVAVEYDVHGVQLQARVDDFEARVVAWRKQVVGLHSKHFPKRS